MKSKLASFGRSLKVPIVQELAKEKLVYVPSRYVRPDHHPHPHPRHIPSSLTQIPLIDMHSLFDPIFMDSELDKLHTACKEWGYGQAFVVSQEQKLDRADVFYVVTLPTHLRKPHLIPKLPSKFKDAIKTYAEQLKVVATKILNIMAKALGMKCEEIETLFEEGTQSMRVNYYPPCPQPELVTGLSPHSDAGGLTILLQVNGIQGLEIKKDGIWIPVSPLPNAFAINLGDVLEIVSNGTYRSIEHRTSVNAEKERISIATFLNPKHDVELSPSPSIVSPENPTKFKRISMADYMRVFVSKELDGKSHLDFMRV